MKNNCTKCNELIDSESQFCQNCGFNRNNSSVLSKPNTIFLTFLCVLTIIGSVFTVLRAFLYSADGIEEMTMMVRISFYVLTSIGTTVGAIKMLQKDKAGLIIYSVSQLIYIITVFFALAHYIKVLESLFDGGGLATFIALLFIVPSVLILIMYWMPDVRKHLK